MPIEIVYKQENNERFIELWSFLCIKAKVSARYLPESLDTLLSMSKDEGLFLVDKSFIYVVDNVPKAGVFFPIEKYEDESNYGTIVEDYIDAPIILDEKIEKKVFSIIDEIAKEYGFKKIQFLIDPLDFSPYNYLQKYNYLDTSNLLYVVDLQGKDNLLSSCRRGHKSDIKRILNNEEFKVFYIDKDDPKYDIHEEYRVLHHKCSGKVTRSKETFDTQFEKLKKGNAVLFGLNYKEKNIAYSYFEFNAHKAAYASAADDPDYDHMHLYHILIYSAMEYLKERGITHIDMEPPSCPSPQIGELLDKKQNNIALFKRGFGGKFVQNFKGVKYFSRELFEQEMNVFIKKYIECQQQTKNNFI
jgi:hypothetical protein